MYSVPFSAFNGSVEFDTIAGVELSMPSGGGLPDNGPGLYRFESLIAVPEASAWLPISSFGSRHAFAFSLLAPLDEELRTFSAISYLTTHL